MNTRLRIDIKEQGIYTCRFRFLDENGEKIPYLVTESPSPDLEAEPPERMSDSGYKVTYPAFLPFLCFQEYPSPDEPAILTCNVTNRRLRVNLDEDGFSLDSIDLLLSSKDTALLTEGTYYWDFFFHYIYKAGNPLAGHNSRQDFTEVVVHKDDPKTLTFYAGDKFTGFFEIVFNDFTPGDFIILTKATLLELFITSPVPDVPSIYEVQSIRSQDKIRRIITNEYINPFQLPFGSEKIIIFKLFFDKAIKTHQASGRARVLRKVHC